MRIPSAIQLKSPSHITMSLQRAELYHFSAVDVFFELLKRRICYYTKKVQQSEEPELVSDGRKSIRVIRSKLRKREESSGVVRTNVVHPEGVLQAPVVDPKPPPSLESVFVSSTPDGGSLPFSPSDTSLSSCTSTESTLDSTYSVPMFLYSTGNSRNSLNLSSQSIPVHPCAPIEEVEKHRRKHMFKGLRRKKTPPSNHSYAIPIEYQDDLKKIYVY